MYNNTGSKVKRLSRLNLERSVSAKIDIEEVSLGNGEVYNGLVTAMHQLGMPAVAFFLDMVPERGYSLYQKFLEWQKENGPSVTWSPFILEVLRENQISILFPKECHLSEVTRGEFLPLINDLLDALVVSEDLVQIYFGEGEPYEASRQVSCSGCDIFACPHWLAKNSSISSC
jgi:hypothetical protein